MAENNGLRDYQRRTVDGVRAHYGSPGSALRVRRCPDPARGKTRMGEELIDDEPGHGRGARTAESSSRRRIGASAMRFGARAVGMIMPGEYSEPQARVQVATVQTLLARGARPPAGRLVLDEAHHYVAEDYRRLVEAYPRARVLGLTATPERLDGEPLGDIFGEIVVSASYSELIAGGFLVPARAHRPDLPLGNDLAQDPVTAWHLYSEGSRAFVFCGRVADAHAWAKRFRDAGVRAAVIEAATPKAERDETLALFVRGVVRVIANVNTMTEGVDVPEARTIILASAFGHVGKYLQAAGRGLRTAKDKPDMILIDLVGASHRHGLPTDDRTYSLQGRPISAPGPQHGGGGGAADYSQEIKGVELRMIARGALPPEATPEPVQERPVDDAERRAELDRLKSLARQNRMRPVGCGGALPREVRGMAAGGVDDMKTTAKPGRVYSDISSREIIECATRQTWIDSALLFLRFRQRNKENATGGRRRQLARRPHGKRL